MKSRTKARRRAAQERAAAGPRTAPRDPLQALIDHARILDSVLEGAEEQLGSLHFPSRFGVWLAQFPVGQAGNDQRVREFTDYLAHLRGGLHDFVQTCADLPEELRRRLGDAGTGTERFSALVDDPRLLARPIPRRQQLGRFLAEARARLSELLEELDRQSERAYR